MAYRPRVGVTAEDVVREVLETERQRWNCLSNDFKIIANVDGSNNRKGIRSAIDALTAGGEGELFYAPAVSKALAAAKDRHPHYSFGSNAFHQRILDQAEYLRFDITSPTDLGDVMEWMISEPAERVPLSSFGQEYQRQQTEAKQVAEARLRLLASILEGRKTTYPEWSSKHGQVRYIDAHSLESKTNEELAVIERETTELRRRMGMSKDKQRETLHEFSNTNRVGYDDKGNEIRNFDNRPKTDSLDAPAVRPYSEGSASAIVGRKVTEGGAVGPTDPFINKNGQEYSKKEIYTIAKTDLALFRSIMKKDSARLNRILGN